ncbi:MAG: calcium/sodium antiporter [Bacteroidaceae bacterium]|nr:calcium/sodium antiporter [Bacteroidaceae bacterium]
MLILIAKLTVALAAIILSADWMTNGASAIALKLKIRPFIVGLTIVAMGTSAPELFVSLSSALASNSPEKAGMVDIALGNVVGSNIFNCLLIVGIVSLVAPVNVARNTVKRDIPIVFASSMLLASLVFYGQIGRLHGIVFLVCFVGFLFLTVSDAKKGRQDTEEGDTGGEIKPRPVWHAVLLIVVGLAVLVYSSDVFVNAASGIAAALGVSDKIIGLTIVGIGTSAPELATSIMAARKGQGEMAVGNVIGSNIFNILFILGLTAVVHPLAGFTINLVDIGVMVFSALLFWVFSRTKYMLERWEGGVMTLVCAAYLCWLVATQA